MNKKNITSLFSFLTILTGCKQNETPPNYLDVQKYTINEELTYTVLLYDTRNSIILSMLNAAKDTPDQAAEVLAIRQKHPENMPTPH